MNEYSQPGFGRISVHGNGMGAPTPEMIEKRARELAMIDERDPDDFTNSDWDQARAELMGMETDGAPEEIRGSPSRSEEWSPLAVDSGHRAPRPGTEEDEESLGQHLVSDGVDEATHDSMVEARREERSQERDLEELE